MPFTTTKPVGQFSDINGKPLDGQVWFGQPNLDPIANPITVYWDAAGTQPVTQPVVTVGGYPMNGNTRSNVFVNADYSILVRNRNGFTVFSAPNLPFEDSSDNQYFLQAGIGAVQRTVQAKLRDVVSVKDFGAVLDGVIDDSSSVQAAFTYANGKGLCVTFPGSACKLASSISLNNYSNFSVDFGNCAVSYTTGSGVYAYDATQAGDISFSGGTHTGTSNLNNFIKTEGSAAAQATSFPTIPADSQWSRRLYFADMLVTGFSNVFTFNNFTREVWITNCNLSQNVKAIGITGKVVNTHVLSTIIYSSLASSNVVVCRGNLGDVAWRYAEGLFFTNCICDVQGYAFDIQDFYLLRVSGGQIQSPTYAIAVTKGICPLTRNFWFTDVQFNGQVIIGSGLAAQHLFDGTFDGVFQDIANTAVGIVGFAKGITVRGQFDNPTGTPVAMSVGGNCTGIKFSPDYVDAAYTTIFTCAASSVTGVKANFKASWTPGIAFGGASVGVTGSFSGSYQWQDGFITGTFLISLTSKGSSVGVATITGLPFASNSNGTVTIGKYSSFNTAFYPLLDVSSASTVINVKTSGGGSEATFSDVDFSNTSLLNGSFMYPVS